MADSNYSVLKPNSYIDRLTLKKRFKMFQIFTKTFPEHAFETVLDAGVTADQHAICSNYFEKYFPHKNKIIALSNQNAAFLEEKYPGLVFRYGDVRALPFNNESIDVVFSSAVIEHVGSRENQKKMIVECLRVAKKGVFLTTPNRWFPIETHTFLPCIHWFPKNIHRIILKMMGLKFHSLEENLNLLDSKTLNRLCKELNIKTYSLQKIRTFGWVSNLVLVIKK